MKAIVLAWGFILLLPLSAGSHGPLTMSVSPRVMMAPGFLRVRTMIEASQDNRAMEVVADSPMFFRSSSVTLDGDRAPRVNEFVFKSLPAGSYDVRVTLIGTSGPRAVQVSRFFVAGVAGDLGPRN